MCPAISALSDLTNRPITSGSIVSSSDHEGWRNDVEPRIAELNDVVADLENNYSGTGAPTDTTDGKEWYDSDLTGLNARINGEWRQVIAGHWSQTDIYNFGFTVTIDSPDSGDITINFKQGDNSTDPTTSNSVVVGFWGRQDGLRKTAADSLKLDSTDHLELDTYAANTETTIFIYAIDRGGTLEWGAGRRPDYTRATSDFVNTEGTATDRNKVFCSAAITANDPCRVVAYFKATYNTTTPDWDSVTSESDVVGPVPGPHPRSICQAWINFTGSGTISINESLNIVSITDNGTGDYTITFDTDFAGTDYCAVGMAARVGTNADSTIAGKEVTPATAGTYRIRTNVASSGGTDDAKFVSAAFFGDQ